MTTLFDDLLAAQAEMPNLQKSAINPHFGNKFVPLEELMETVIPVLNKHNLVLMQLPTVVDGQAGLTSSLIHKTGERIESTMLLMCAKSDPQGQGSAITYARRYSLMAMLGLSADVDDDGHKATNGNGLKEYAQQKLQGGTERPATTGGTPERPPVCDAHGPLRYWAAGIGKKSGQPYEAFWGCKDKGCKVSVNAAEWSGQQAQFARARGDDPPHDPDALPFE